MANTILCVFEGEKREPNYFGSLEKYFFGQEALVKCSYGNDLYHLLEKLEKDDDLDIVELIRESKDVPSNQGLLQNLDRDDVAQVFLFFDMEIQDDNFSFENLRKMISLFKEETGHGKLYISYPMVEALRDIPSYDDFHQLKVHRSEIKGYKKLSAERGKEIPSDHRKITKQNWLDLIRCSVDKAKYMIDDSRCLYPEQLPICGAQSQAYEKDRHIYVLSAFPFFLREYFGETLKEG